jgi:hypothetical protein
LNRSRHAVIVRPPRHGADRTSKSLSFKAATAINELGGRSCITPSLRPLELSTGIHRC